MSMQHAVTQRGVTSVPATQDMVAMEYLAQVYCNALLVIITHVTISTSVFFTATIHCSNTLSIL